MGPDVRHPFQVWSKVTTKRRNAPVLVEDRQAVYVKHLNCTKPFTAVLHVATSSDMPQDAAAPPSSTSANVRCTSAPQRPPLPFGVIA